MSVNEPSGGILLLVDDSPSTRLAIEDAVMLAQRLRAPLRAVFVEERDLLRSAGFPFAHEIGAATGSVRPVSSASVEARLRERAAALRASLERVSAQHSIASTFITVRGSIPDAAREHIAGADWLVMGRVGWSGDRGHRLGHAARVLAAAPPCRAFFSARAVHRSAGASGIAVIARPGDDPSALARATASLLQTPEESVLILLPPDAVPFDMRHATVREAMRTAGVSDARIRAVPLSVGEPSRTLQFADARIVVMQVNAQPENASALLAGIEVPVVLLP
ncbi:universal stress protein [Algiphilus sp.]|uniref:universal stress protein n=1 Tax=Algiphilus sp. TaxID=1872431 RepID=UPI003C3946D4